MNKKYTGHCACGTVTYGFDTQPTFIANCRCTDCKRASGGEMATFVAVPETDFTVLSGNTKSFSYGPNTETCAGQGLDRVFCTICGSRVVSNNLKDGSGIVFVQEGTLDRLEEWFAPKLEIFTRSRPKWARPLDPPQFGHGSKFRVAIRQLPVSPNNGVQNADQHFGHRLVPRVSFRGPLLRR